MRYEILQSGSDGNATLVDGQILIDCGTAWKTIMPIAQDLRLVLLTHQHGDHFNRRTVKRLAKARPALRWACGEWMVQLLLEAGVRLRCIDVLDMDSWYSYLLENGAVKVSPFATRHDVPNCGWKLYRTPTNSLFYATDLGDLGGISAKGYAVYLLEANYREEEMRERIAAKMDAGGFAYETRAQDTHLSYEQAMEWLAVNMEPGSTWVPMHEHKEREKNDAKQADQGNNPNIEKG